MKLLSSMALAMTLALAGPIAMTPASAQKAGTAKSTKSKAATPKTKAKATPKKAAPKKSAAKPAKKAAPKSKKSATKSKSASASPCKGLSQTQCSANRSCGWIKPKKKVSTNGRKLTAYCRKVAAKK